MEARAAVGAAAAGGEDPQEPYARGGGKRLRGDEDAAASGGDEENNRNGLGTDNEESAGASAQRGDGGRQEPSPPADGSPEKLGPLMAVLFPALVQLNNGEQISFGARSARVLLPPSFKLLRRIAPSSARACFSPTTAAMADKEALMTAVGEGLEEINVACRALEERAVSATNALHQSIFTCEEKQAQLENVWQAATLQLQRVRAATDVTESRSCCLTPAAEELAQTLRVAVSRDEIQYAFGSAISAASARLSLARSRSAATTTLLSSSAGTGRRTPPVSGRRLPPLPSRRGRLSPEDELLPNLVVAAQRLLLLGQRGQMMTMTKISARRRTRTTRRRRARFLTTTTTRSSRRQLRGFWSHYATSFVSSWAANSLSLLPPPPVLPVSPSSVVTAPLRTPSRACP